MASTKCPAFNTAIPAPELRLISPMEVEDRKACPPAFYD
jgi:hypothetical protein